MSQSMAKKWQQAGFSIIELMVALALGAALAAGISSVYLENKKNYVMDEEVARLQENGRFAIDILKREIKMAGFFGGISDLPTPAAGNAIASGCMPTDLWTLNSTHPIDVIDDAINGTLPTSSGGANLSTCISAAQIYSTIGNDVLIVKRLADRASMRSKVVDSGLVNSAGAIAPRSGWYLVEDSTGVNSYKHTSSGLFVGASISSSGNDHSGQNVWLYESKIYWVRECSVCTPVSDKIPTLVVTYLDGDAYKTDALVEGVEAFHMEFGLASTTASAVGTRAPEIFTPNPTSAELSRISVVRVYLLLRTRETIRDYTDNNTYVLGTKAPIVKSSSPDNYKRKLFTTTITVRNT